MTMLLLLLQRLERTLLVFEEAQDAGRLTPELYNKWVNTATEHLKV